MLETAENAFFINRFGKIIEIHVGNRKIAGDIPKGSDGNAERPNRFFT